METQRGIEPERRVPSDREDDLVQPSAGWQRSGQVIEHLPVEHPAEVGLALGTEPVAEDAGHANRAELPLGLVELAAELAVPTAG